MEHVKTPPSPHAPLVHPSSLDTLPIVSGMQFVLDTLPIVQGL